MKTYKNLWDSIIATENVELAHDNAKRGKMHYRDVVMVESKLPSHCLVKLRESLIAGTFTTSEYQVETIDDRGKEREIHKLPYYPDRIVHHALMQVVGPIIDKMLIHHTYQSINGRGCFKAKRDVVRYIRSHKSPETLYSIKIDVRKFYPSIENSRLKEKLSRFLRCHKTLNLINNIIDSNDGLPIGNYTSQYLGNLFLNDLDHYAKRTLKIKGYWRYCDDLLILCENDNVERFVSSITEYIRSENLEIKHCYVNKLDQGASFCGFVFYHNRTRIRRKIKRNFIGACRSNRTKSVKSYHGWCKHTNAFNLWSVGFKLLKNKNWRKI